MQGARRSPPSPASRASRVGRPGLTRGVDTCRAPSPRLHEPHPSARPWVWRAHDATCPLWLPRAQTSSELPPLAPTPGKPRPSTVFTAVPFPGHRCESRTVQRFHRLLSARGERSLPPRRPRSVRFYQEVSGSVLFQKSASEAAGLRPPRPAPVHPASLHPPRTHFPATSGPRPATPQALTW